MIKVSRGVGIGGTLAGLICGAVLLQSALSEDGSHQSEDVARQAVATSLNTAVDADTVEEAKLVAANDLASGTSTDLSVEASTDTSINAQSVDVTDAVISAEDTREIPEAVIDQPTEISFNNSISSPSVAATLAWTIAAYVNCTNYNAMAANVRKEVTTAETDFDQTLEAMQLLISEEFVCNRMKQYAGSMVKLAESDPAAFHAEFGLVQDVLLSEIATNSAGTSSNSGVAIAPLGVGQVGAPPQSGSGSATSDY